MSGRKTETRELLLPPEVDWRDATQAIRAGQIRTQEQEHAEVIYPTSSYVFKSAAEAAATFAGDNPGNVYSRYTNPTVRMFEERLAALEGAENCVATASGMAAIVSACMALLKSGDHVICSRNVFGTTHAVFDKYMKKFGVETTFVPLTDMEGWRAAIKSNTRLLFIETPSNPLNEVADIAALAQLAHANGALLAVDNCFCTPVLQKPLSLGADLVIHSATKYLDGQGRCLGGAVVGDKALTSEVLAFLRSGGFTMSPFNAWVFLKGLETLPIRMKAHCESGMKVAQWLNEQSWVEKVHYCGLPDHPGHELATRQQKGYGGVLSFKVKGGREEAWSFIDNTKWISITANLGDVKSTMTHPATTTHGRLSDDDKALAGISENLIRLCVGLEDFEDIREDLLAGAAALDA
ncbi:O-succinylhomoserine sulfhydrylase [Hahella sp. KA22]|uniref:O-succinylhomoserine sulfhydrylase n=1 Tax=Hahella sp. KA22 TaxID=1628392 RepID=UPI000FDE1426|nr:O-succinylhomoserine sulfhydrylase [Hahella sp. KA22]AZZ91723.1 O-succinylhomoserine sulfhydrylase [Hahella sp. KA22]QAY55093.1 O-succinylhomoserine sulfhydrylase [Hahella sp. KA22]